MPKAFFLLLFYFLTPNAHAVRFYYELGGGVAQIRGGDPFFGSGTASVLGLGTALNLGIGLDFAKGMSEAHFHLGIQERLSTGAKDGVSYSMHAPYGYVRMDTDQFYVTAGAAPLVWNRVAAAAGFDAFQRVSGGIGVLGELGLSFPITPIVTFSFVTGGQVVMSGGTISPKPSLELSGVLRVYTGGRTQFDKERKYYGEGGMGEYEGYRYPYGFDPRH